MQRMWKVLLRAMAMAAGAAGVLALCVGVFVAFVLLSEGRVFYAGGAGVCVALSAVFFRRIWRGLQKGLAFGVFVLGLIGVFLCWHFGMPAADYEDICSDLGVCAGKIISYEECLKDEGRWVKVNDEEFCFMKWSVMRGE